MNPRIYLPFASPQWRLKMGLKALDLKDWIDIDDRAASYLTYKAELLQTRYSEVFASLPGSETGQREVLELLIAHLGDYFPQDYRVRSQQIECRLTGEIWSLAEFAANPLDLAGRLVQEDLCLMQASPEGYRLVAGSVCFPSHWRLQEKLGQPIAQIHQPVPAYSQMLERPVDQFFERLTVEHPGYRWNWSIVDTPELFLGHARAQAAADLGADAVGQKLWIRVERQTLRRLPLSQMVLFTIRTYLYPLAILDSEPAIAANLAGILQQMPLAMQHYKSLQLRRSVLLEYLGKLAGKDYAIGDG